ncbi:MAG: sulfite exporter TauE/SafE family protein [Clostridia bacterium]|nr:sulfite exporter TauE/SafE family protein [Clostridia bacterium]
MDILKIILVCFLAGAGAGIGTGFAGMSAAAVIGPILVTFLGVAPYEAVGIGLISDVLASAVSAYTYKKNGNLDIKNSLPLMISVLIFTVIGSFVAKFMPAHTMSGLMQVSMIFIGIRFFIKSLKENKEKNTEINQKNKLIKSIIGGIIIGFICGFVGAGGGMMMLFVLTTFLGYQTHNAVGTSVFIMTFTALTGGISHFAIAGTSNILSLVLCVIFTLLWAKIASVIANKSNLKILNRVVGAVMVTTGIAILIFDYVIKAK